MKLHFPKRDFSWVEPYAIYEEDGQAAYRVSGEAGAKLRKIFLKNRNDMVLGTVVGKKSLFGKWSYSIFLDEERIGTVEKYSSHGVKRYELNCNRWRLYGNILGFEYDIYDDKYLVLHAGNEDNSFPGEYVIDTSYSNNEVTGLLVALAMEAANGNAKWEEASHGPAD